MENPETITAIRHTLQDCRREALTQASLRSNLPPKNAAFHKRTYPRFEARGLHVRGLANCFDQLDRSATRVSGSGKALLLRLHLLFVMFTNFKSKE